MSCNAPRNNPLDAENPDNISGTIEGYIQTISVPHKAIPLAKIFWENGGIISQTDQHGYFVIRGIEAINGNLILEHSDYSSDTVYIDFSGSAKYSRTFFLNSTPKIIDYKFYSITINKYPSKQDYNLEAIVNIIDEENDIDSVFIENGELDSRVYLNYNASTKYYESPIYLSDLNLTLSIDAVIGKLFNITVVDSDNKKFTIGNSTIKRIIKEEIVTTSPTGRDTVETGNPFLSWRKFSPGFEFRYLIEIYTDELPAVLVWQKEASSNKIELQTDANLQSGDYFWVIWAIDEFENRTRSKASSFIIK